MMGHGDNNDCIGFFKIIDRKRVGFKQDLSCSCRAWGTSKRKLDCNRGGLFKSASEFDPETDLHFIIV
jgi:hypothetical protein